MTSRNYSALFARGNIYSIQMLRAAINALDIDADPYVFFRDEVGKDVGIVCPMFTFRTAQPPNLELFDVMAARWSDLQLVLLHRTYGREPVNGFAVYEQGRRVRYGGQRVPPGREEQFESIVCPEQKLFGRHLLQVETIEKRMHSCGIAPDDPIDDKRSEAEDW